MKLRLPMELGSLKLCVFIASSYQAFAMPHPQSTIFIDTAACSDCQQKLVIA